MSPPPAPVGTPSPPPSLPPPTPPATIVGRGVDAYLKNCDAFMDTSGDRQLSNGEVYSMTDSLGGFEFQPSSYDAAVSSGLVIITRNESRTGTPLECVDAFTGQPPGLQILTAPAGSKIISPLTTLIGELIRLYSGDVDMTIAEAQTMLNSGLGLGNADITQVDPIYASANGDIATYGPVVAAITTVANLVSSLGTILYGTTSLNSGRLTRAQAEMKVYAGIARQIENSLAVAARGNRKLLASPALDLSSPNAITDISKSSLYESSLSNIGLGFLSFTPVALEAVVQMNVNSAQSIKNILADLSDPTALLKLVAAAAKVSQNPEALEAALSSAIGEALSPAQQTALDELKNFAQYNAKLVGASDSIVVTIPLYPPPPSPPPPSQPPPYVSKGAVLNSSELAATITVPVLFVVIVTMLVAMRQIAKRRRARRLARFEARNEREVQSMEAQKSVKKINAEAMKRELALLQDERAAERALIKTYEQHMKKSKEKVEKAIALRIQLEKERKAAKRAESIQNR